MVMVLGVDVHEDTHTTVAVDQAGRQQALRTVRATDAGHEHLVAWARRECPHERVWAVEDCRYVSTRLERAALCEPDLPAAVHDDVFRELKLLVTSGGLPATA
jgi:hypothetical protein